MGGANVGVRFLSIAATIVLARILDPADFGIMALGMVIVSTSNLFSGLGMGEALIQSTEDIKRVSYQAFIMSSITGFFLATVIFLNASLLAELFDKLTLTPIIEVISLCVFLNTLAIIPDALLKKNLLFFKRSLITITVELLYIATALTFAYLDYGVWSLVYGTLARYISQGLLLWIASPGWEWILPKPWDSALMKNMLKFGIKFSSSGFLTFFNSNWHNIFVAKIFSPLALGFYKKGFDFANMTVSSFNMVVNSVLFPSYSKIQKDRGRLERAYLTSLQFVSLVTIPMALGIYAIAPDMVRILLGEKWLPMISILKIFAIMSLVRPLSGTTSPLFLSVGRPENNIRVSILHASIMLPLAFFMMNKSIEQVGVAVTLAFSIGLIFNIYQAQKIIPGTVWKILTTIFPSLVAGALMVVGIFFTRSLLLGNGH